MKYLEKIQIPFTLPDPGKCGISSRESIVRGQRRNSCLDRDIWQGSYTDTSPAPITWREPLKPLKWDI